MVRVHPKNPRAAKQRAYFPGYLFVRADLAELGPNTLNWIPGTHGLVTFGGEPAIVPQHLITELRYRVDSINAAGGLIFDRLEKVTKYALSMVCLQDMKHCLTCNFLATTVYKCCWRFWSQYPQPVKLMAADIERI